MLRLYLLRGFGLISTHKNKNARKLWFFASNQGFVFMTVRAKIEVNADIAFLFINEWNG